MSIQSIAIENKEQIQEKFKIINDKLDRVLLNQKEILDYIKNIKYNF